MIHNMTDEYTVEQRLSCNGDFDFITLEFSDHEQEMQTEEFRVFRREGREIR